MFAIICLKANRDFVKEVRTDEKETTSMRQIMEHPRLREGVSLNFRIFGFPKEEHLSLLQGREKQSLLYGWFLMFPKTWYMMAGKDATCPRPSPVDLHQTLSAIYIIFFHVQNSSSWISHLYANTSLSNCSCSCRRDFTNMHRKYLAIIFPPAKQSIIYCLPDFGQVHSFRTWAGAWKPAKHKQNLNPKDLSTIGEVDRSASQNSSRWSTCLVEPFRIQLPIVRLLMQSWVLGLCIKASMTVWQLNQHLLMVKRSLLL